MQLLMGRFLSTDWEQLLYHMYVSCIQGNWFVINYTNEFMWPAERNQLTDVENQKVVRFVNWLIRTHYSKWEQSAKFWILQAAINMAVWVNSQSYAILIEELEEVFLFYLGSSDYLWEMNASVS